MQPGLTTDQYVIVNKTAYLFRAPGGAAMCRLSRSTRDTGKDYIKRVIGLPGV